MSIHIYCPFCGKQDVPRYTAETGEHRVLASWACGSAGICRFLECRPESGQRIAKWWNAKACCTCAAPWNECARFRAKHPQAIEETPPEIVPA